MGKLVKLLQKVDSLKPVTIDKQVRLLKLHFILLTVLCSSCRKTLFNETNKSSGSEIPVPKKSLNNGILSKSKSCKIQVARVATS